MFYTWAIPRPSLALAGGALPHYPDLVTGRLPAICGVKTLIARALLSDMAVEDRASNLVSCPSSSRRTL